MRTRVKVCCIQSLEEAHAAIGMGADSVGLVSAMPSGPGPINDETIAAIAARVPPAVTSFLLTSRTAPDEVVAHVRACGTSAVQLVDAVPLATYRALREACPALRVVQVVHVEDERALDEAARLAPLVDAVLLDSGRPGDEVKQLGGTGRVHDWSVSRQIARTIETPVFLAGGLNAANVLDAIQQVRPFGVDLCSGVRTDGALDEAKLREFMLQVRHADQARLR